MTGFRRFLYDNGVSIAFGVLFVAALVGQAIAGWADFNNDELRHHAAEVTFWRYGSRPPTAVNPPGPS